MVSIQHQHHCKIFIPEKKKRKKKKKKKEDILQLDLAREDDIDDEPRTAWTSKVVTRKHGQVSSSQLDLVIENGIEDEKVKQLLGTKTTLVTILLMIGE